jgi:hypothetical protein
MPSAASIRFTDGRSLSSRYCGPMFGIVHGANRPFSFELTNTQPDQKGTLREHQPGYARPRRVTRPQPIPPTSGISLAYATRACPRFPPRCSMVRRGSPVRVRKRASLNHHGLSKTETPPPGLDLCVGRCLAGLRVRAARLALSSRRRLDLLGFRVTHVTSCGTHRKVALRRLAILSMIPSMSWTKTHR